MEPRDIRLYRRGTALAFVVAPLLLLVDNLIHPKEYSPGNEAAQLEKIGSAYERWQLAHLFGFAAALVFVAAVLGLAFLVRRRQPRLGLWGGALGLAGLVGLSGVIAIDGFTWGVLGEVSTQPGTDPATIEAALDEVQSSNWSLPFYLCPLAWLAGMVVLAVGAVRQRAIPGWTGALLVLATLMVGTEPIVTENAYFIAGAASFLVAGAAVALALARMDDARFAAGGGVSEPS
jgi:hypothetical protein